jgi:hypothetical protein
MHKYRTYPGIRLFELVIITVFVILIFVGIGQTIKGLAEERLFVEQCVSDRGFKPGSYDICESLFHRR